jgi:hypothetical protein
MSKPVFRSELDAILLLKDKEKVEAERRLVAIRARLRRAERNAKRRVRWTSWLERRVKLGFSRLLHLPPADMERESRRLEVRREHARRHAARLIQKQAIVRALAAKLELAQAELARIEAELDSYRRQREVRYREFLRVLAKKEDERRDEDQILRHNQRREE